MERLDRTGSFLPRGVSHCINGEMVTYAQLKAERVKRQQAHLGRVLSIDWPVRRAAYLWTFYQPGLFGFAYAGWWAYLRIMGQEDVQLRWDIIGGQDVLLQQCMEAFPCGVFPIRENFGLWKEAFGSQYRRPGRFKDQGLTPVWVTLRSHGFPQIELNSPAAPAARPQPHSSLHSAPEPAS